MPFCFVYGGGRPDCSGHASSGRATLRVAQSSPRSSDSVLLSRHDFAFPGCILSSFQVVPGQQLLPIVASQRSALLQLYACLLKLLLPAEVNSANTFRGHMFASRRSNSRMLVSGIFCEPFSVANAIAGLLRSGFANNDIHAVGVLQGQVPAVSEFLLAIGLPIDLATLYSDYFADGGVLLLVRIEPTRRKTAFKLMKRYGGMCTHAIHDCEITDGLSACTTGSEGIGEIL